MTANVRYDKALALDLEMTCWQDECPPPGQAAEIIEIGLAEADLRALRVTRRESFLCRPARSEVTAYCTQLTGLTRERLIREGRPLAETLNRIAKTWGGRSRPVFVWGDDLAELTRQAREQHARTDLFPVGHDLSGMVRAIAQAQPGGPLGSGSGISVEDALAMLGLAFEGRPHSGVDDAANTARILIELTRRVWT